MSIGFELLKKIPPRWMASVELGNHLIAEYPDDLVKKILFTHNVIKVYIPYLFL